MRPVTLILVLAAALLSGCVHVRVGPFFPAHPVYCDGTPMSCRVDETCLFLAVDTRAVCVPQQ